MNQIYVLCCTLIFITSCSGQNQSSIPESKIKQPPNSSFKLPFSTNSKIDPESKIGEYVREIFQDKKGNIWFGTLAFGVTRYDGKNLVYFSKEEGLVGSQINVIAEDQIGNVWFATTEGVSKYDGKTFTNFTEKDGLKNNSTWSILADSRGNIWVGTMKGVSRYNGASFADFPLPTPNIKKPTSRFNIKLVWSMIEDKEGNIWFGTDGVGVCKYDPRLHDKIGREKSFSHFTKKDGLCSNDVTSILEDSRGGFWFGSRETRAPENENSFYYVDSGDGGLVRYDGESFQKFPEIKGLMGKDIGSIYEDKTGNIWIASKHNGAYRFDGKMFDNFLETEGIAAFNCIQSFLQDKDGKMWVGFSGGLFRFDVNSFVHITKDGPWY